VVAYGVQSIQDCKVVMYVDQMYVIY